MQNPSTIGSAEDRIFQEMLGRYDAPAYIRRARRVQQAYDDLLAICQRQREQWLGMVRVRLATVYASAGEWSALVPFLADDGQCRVVAELYEWNGSENLGITASVGGAA